MGIGNSIFYTRPPELAPHIGAPLWRSPFTDLMSHIEHQDGNPECLPFELRFLDCMEAYGKEMGTKKCRYYYQDFVECTKQWKQRARLEDMWEQRYYLWVQGLIGNKERVPLYKDHPRYDGYLPNFLTDDTHWKSA